jgi:hypothetical protein
LDCNWPWSSIITSGWRELLDLFARISGYVADEKLIIPGGAAVNSVSGL